MKKILRNLILSTIVTLSSTSLIINHFKEDTKTLNIEEKIALYFSFQNAMYKTESIIGDTITGNEVGYDTNGDTTYYLIKENQLDIIKWYNNGIIHTCKRDSSFNLFFNFY